jgi:hypothetical protein
LQFLDLGQNEIGDAGAVALVNSSSLTALRKLNLTGNPISDATIGNLTNSQAKPGLTVLTGDVQFPGPEWANV